MKTEIEVKFLNVQQDHIRDKLTKLGAVCEQPMRLMKRALIDYDDRRLQKGTPWAFVRIRDEGDKTVLTYKELEREAAVDGAREIETVVDDFESTVAIFEAIGLKCHSRQESRRETWKLNDCEIVIDEWPWLKPYIEIEGVDEASVRKLADALGFDWSDAVFGSAMMAYQLEYPHLTETDTLGTVPIVRFGDPLPELLKPKERA